MEKPSDYIYADQMTPEMRNAALSFVFRDIFTPKGFLLPEAVKGDVLDLGCGKGAVGRILKSKNPEINLTGVDIYNYPEIKKSKIYSQFVKSRAFNFLKKAEEKSRQRDFIISVGMPPDEVEKIIEQIDPDKILKPGGWIILVVDSPLSPLRNKKFKIKETELPIATNIAYYSRSPDWPKSP